MTHPTTMHTRPQSGRYWNTGATADQGHALNTRTQEVHTMRNRYTETERLITAALRLARLNLQEGQALDGLTRSAKYDAVDDEAAEILAALADKLETEAAIMAGGRS